MKQLQRLGTLTLLVSAIGAGLASCGTSESGSDAATESAETSAASTAPATATTTPADALLDSAKQWFQPIPEKLDKVRDQALTDERVSLGQSLFFDPRLSGSQTISCNSCHNLATAGADNVVTSTGHGGQKGPRNSPTVLNSVFNVAQFWDGRAPDLKEQAKGPVQNPVEMHNDPERVEATLRSMPGYVEAFGKAFPGQANPISFENMAVAIEAFEATLLTPGSKFDQFLTGQAALSDEERKGLSLFIDNGCVACHSGSNVGGQAYFAFGAVKRPDASVLPPADKGRAAITHVAGDEFVFRAAPLRNVALTAPYFHSGQVWDLRQAVSIMSESQLGKTLPATDVDAIVAFLRTLNGTMPVVGSPQLPASTDTTPHPL